MATYKKGIALMVAAAAVAFIQVVPASASAPEECVKLPAGVNNQSVLGQDIPGVKDVRICVRTNQSSSGEPQVRNYEGCGDPCFAVVVRDLKASVDVQLGLSYTLGGQTHVEPMGVSHTIEPLQGTHQCVYSYYDGTYNPCRDGISTPANLVASAAKTRIALSWDRSFAFGESRVQHYEIRRSTTGAEGTFEPVGTSTGLTFTDSGLPRGTTFWYTVAAVDDRGNRSGDAHPVEGSTR